MDLLRFYTRGLGRAWQRGGECAHEDAGSRSVGEDEAREYEVPRVLLRRCCVHFHTACLKRALIEP